MQKSALQVKNVVYKNIKGTSASEVAMRFDCSKAYPCQGILLQDINLERAGDRTAKALCNNVKLATLGVVYPKCSWWKNKYIQERERELEQGMKEFPSG